MAEYIYKGFKVHYDIKPAKIADSYQALGSVVCYVDGTGPTLTQKFQTEAATKIEAKHEIKKIINDYIDFEWQQFLEMQGSI